MTRKRKALSLVVVVLLSPSLAFAQAASKIESGLGRAATWAAGVGLLVGTLGLIYSGIRLNTGDEEGKAIGQRVMVGSIIICSAAGLMALLKQWFA